MTLLPPPPPLIPVPKSASRAAPAAPTPRPAPTPVLSPPPSPVIADAPAVTKDELLATPRHHARGTFITFEGQDGTGKTMQAAALTAHLSAAGRHVLSTTEPGGTDIGQMIREIVLNNQLYVDPQAEALLFAADRAQHVNTRVIPALQRGDTVIHGRSGTSACGRRPA